MNAPKNIIEAMRRVVDYDWQNEERDYEEAEREGNETDGHVFEDLRTVDAWLSTVEDASGAQSDRELREQNEADRRVIRDTHSGEEDVLGEYASRTLVKAELPGSGLSVELWYGEADGIPVVQIDGPDEPDGERFTNADGSPRIRVYINDDRTYDGSAS